MKRMTAILCSLTLLFLLAACGKTQTPAPEEYNSIGTHLSADFTTLTAENSGASAEELAQSLCDSEWLELNGAVMPVEPGFLTGFSQEIDGFSEGAMFAPMIGSIPFVGYVFEVEEDADTFVQTLKDNADLRWNICTEADEMVSAVSGDKVLFVMCPTEFEE